MPRRGRAPSPPARAPAPAARHAPPPPPPPRAPAQVPAAAPPSQPMMAPAQSQGPSMMAQVCNYVHVLCNLRLGSINEKKYCNSIKH